MTLQYLPEHAENAWLALELARKEADHLQYSHRTLFALHIDATWVQQLATQGELAEKVEAFVGARKLRNLLVHEYMSDVQLFLQALLTAREAAEMLFQTVRAIEVQANSVGLKT